MKQARNSEKGTNKGNSSKSARGIDATEAFHEKVLEERASAHRLGRKLMKRWGMQLKRDEFESVVDLALCEAVNRYRSDKGAKFTTYFFYILKGALIKLITTQRQYQAMMQDSVVLHHEGHDDQEQVIDRINSHDTTQSSPDEMLHSKELSEKVQEAMSALSDLEKSVLSEVVVYDFKVAQLARKLGYSRGHLSQVKTQALRKMQSSIEDMRSDIFWDEAA